MLFGYTGKILHVDLSNSKISIEQPTEEFYKTYIGGSAMGTYYLFKNTPAGADPLGPENTLTLMISATTGVSISGNSRMTATAKSPLSGLIGDSQVGGFFPAEMKFAGFDGMVFTGKSPKPVYLWVHDGEAELRDASHLWGKITGEVEKSIREELGVRAEAFLVVAVGRLVEKKGTRLVMTPLARVMAEHFIGMERLLEIVRLTKIMDDLPHLGCNPGG